MGWQFKAIIIYAITEQPSQPGQEKVFWQCGRPVGYIHEDTSAQPTTDTGQILQLKLKWLKTSTLIFIWSCFWILLMSLVFLVQVTRIKALDNEHIVLHWLDKSIFIIMCTRFYIDSIAFEIYNKAVELKLCFFTLLSTFLLQRSVQQDLHSDPCHTAFYSSCWFSYTFLYWSWFNWMWYQSSWISLP